MKIAQLCILVLLIVAGAIPFTSAQNNQTGQAGIYCPSGHSGNCDALHMVGGIPPYTFAPNLGAQLAAVDLFSAFSATGGQTQKNIMITIKISAPFVGLPTAEFRVTALVGSNSEVNLAREAVNFGTNPLVPTEATFALLSVSRFRVILYNLCTSSSCGPGNALVPPGQFYTIEWQIQDPPGNAAVSLPFDLLAIVALVTIPLVAVESVYLVSLRRRLSKKG
jgi:hypothetical protein